MKIQNIGKTVFTLAGLVMSLAAPVSAADNATAYLEHFMNDVKSLEATFTQEVISESGQITQTSYGKFLLQRPGKFRWEYQMPSPQEIISDGKNMWIFDKELEQVTVKPLKSALGSSPAAILTHRHGLEKDYTILETKPREGLQWVDLRPKSPQGDFTKILIGLDDAGIQAMDLYDQFGQITMIRFRESQFNLKLPGRLFNFSPPDGVDVIGKPS